MSGNGNRHTSVRTASRARHLWLLILLLISLVAWAASGGALAQQQTTKFTYQGKLNSGGSPANGSYDLQFQLFDAAAGGTLQGSPNTIVVVPVAVSNGVFTVQLDFGNSAFPGADRFLEIGVRLQGDVNPYTILSPRQQLTSAPYATHSLQLTLDGTASQAVTMTRNTGVSTGSTFTLQSGSPAAGSTDLAGGDLVLAAGLGTGLGGGGNYREQTAGAADVSSSSDNLLVDRTIVVSKAKPMTLASPGFTALMSIHLTGTHTAGGRIYYNIRATDGGSQIATETGIIQYTATANSITCTVFNSDKLHLGTVNSGCTPGFFNPGSQPGISIFDNVSFSTPAAIVVHEVYFRITNESGAAIRLEP